VIPLCKEELGRHDGEKKNLSVRRRRRERKALPGLPKKEDQTKKKNGHATGKRKQGRGGDPGCHQGDKKKSEAFVKKKKSVEETEGPGPEARFGHGERRAKENSHAHVASTGGNSHPPKKDYKKGKKKAPMMRKGSNRPIKSAVRSFGDGGRKAVDE